MRQYACLIDKQRLDSLEEGMADEPPTLVECHFFVPLVRNSDRKLHAPLAWRLLRDALYRHFRGRSGPESIYVAIRATPGEYTGLHGERIEDESYRYVVAIERARVSELRDLLKKIANTFDQEAIYFAVQGEVTFVYPTPADGYLTDEKEG